MSEPKWTPGPWALEDTTRYGSSYAVRDASGGYLAEFEASDWEEEGRECMRATAHLIAAAPDLYEALMQVWADMELGSELEMKTLAVLAKARGETT